jgi:alpha-amylase/alpha-mannosidase (GH57 family)
MSKNYLCIHGHFYQPPRENPWLEEIEFQPSAFPYHDWNERVTRQCYGPNTRARLEGAERRILELINNYEYMNFDFGPTLLSWLERTHPWIYGEVLAADRVGRKRYHGHGNAMAQVYNHIIMPLADTRDKRTQIRWGLADFAHRFGHPAEGMWLAETAVDVESLALMAEEGVRFTILAPTQAQAVRSLGSPRGAWKDVSGGAIDTTQAYRVFPRGTDSLHIDVFFFDEDISKAVAYEKILASGSAFLARIEQGIAGARKETCLVNAATDGESYGHHFKFGDMALAWLFDHLEREGPLELSNYAWFLELSPPQKEVRIVENSSWSCAHGVERWRSDCGCNVGHREGWNQAWRAPLREAMDRLSKELSAIFEEEGGKIIRDPWAARDDYIRILLDSSAESRERFFETHLVKGGGAAQAEKVIALELLESQRMALYMFTSCGWFFDDIAGLEATQVLRYADRAMQLVKKWSHFDLEGEFLSVLARAKSNDPDFGDGAAVFKKRVKPARMLPARIAANHVFMRMFQKNPAPGGLFRERFRVVKEEQYDDQGPGKAAGAVLVSDPMTGNTSRISFSATGRSPADFACLTGEEGGSDASYTLDDVVPDVRRQTMQAMARGILEKVSRQISEEEVRAFFSLAQPAEAMEEPLPGGLGEVLELLLRSRLLRLVEEPESVSREMAFLKEFTRKAAGWESALHVDDPGIRREMKKLVDALMDLIAENPREGMITALMELLDLADDVSLKVDLWKCQNRYWDLSGDRHFLEPLSSEQARVFQALGRRLGFLDRGA